MVSVAPRTIASLILALFFLGTASLHAAPATPAMPADPNQARPAVPVTPVPVAPAPAPTSNPAASTNAAPTSQVAISIIADSSLKQVLQELAQTWADSQDNGPQVPLTLTNAGTLKAKVESGPGWDVVISADVADMKEMNDHGVLFPDGQQSLARNTVVIYGRKALLKDDELDWFDLIGTEWKKVALGNIDLTASGRVADRALQKHDLADDAHKDLYVYGANEEKALGNVERDQADAAFVYKTDLAQVSLPGFAVFPLTTVDAPPVFYIAAVPRLAKNPAQARAFINFCAGETARPIWTKYGFETN